MKELKSAVTALVAAGTGALITWLWIHTTKKSDACEENCGTNVNFKNDGNGCKRIPLKSERGRPSIDSLMQRAIEISKQAVANGNHPFGAILVDKATGAIIVEAENTAMTSTDWYVHSNIYKRCQIV